jgi:hypothetical protein
MKIEKTLVSPNLAKYFLSKNVKNRTIRSSSVFKYAKQMQLGGWREDTGELIKFSENGNLIDGQHRLEAVVLSGVSIYFHIATNLKENITDVLDTGSNRSSSDVFKLNSVQYSSSMPSIIQQYYAMKNNKKTMWGLHKHEKLSNSELLSKYYENSLFWDKTASKSSYLYEKFSKILSHGLIGGMYAHFYDICPISAESFINQLCTGENISNKTILVLRKKLIDDRLQVKKIPMSAKCAYIIKAWNHFRSGIEVSVLKYNSDNEIIKAK